jgi:CheY-like chemotaxis protein
VGRQAKAVETIERNAASLTQIVEDVLDVSRIIAGKLRLNLQALDLSDVVRHAVEAITPSAETRKIHVRADLESGVGPISGDAERIQQIVWNLLTNAVKFTPAGGRVLVRIERSDGVAVLSVTDTGVGIPRDFLPHIFERFRQADSGTTRERGGLGLGLAIVRQLVEMHGGRIQASSEGPGRGATFRLELPIMEAQKVKDPPRADLPARTAMAPMPDLRQVRVMVIDDDVDTLEMIREILEATGAEVGVADSAMSAMALAATFRPDVLVTDIGMPHMDGFDLIDEIRRSGDETLRNVPAAALTAYARSEDRLRALRSGFQIHLAKPIDPAELMAAVASLAKGTALTTPALERSS